MGRGQQRKRVSGTAHRHRNDHRRRSGLGPLINVRVVGTGPSPSPRNRHRAIERPCWRPPPSCRRARPRGIHASSSINQALIQARPLQASNSPNRSISANRQQSIRQKSPTAMRTQAASNCPSLSRGRGRALGVSSALCGVTPDAAVRWFFNIARRTKAMSYFENNASPCRNAAAAASAAAAIHYRRATASRSSGRRRADAHKSGSRTVNSSGSRSPPSRRSGGISARNQNRQATPAAQAKFAPLAQTRSGAAFQRKPWKYRLARSAADRPSTEAVRHEYDAGDDSAARLAQSNTRSARWRRTALRWAYRCLAWKTWCALRLVDGGCGSNSTGDQRIA